MLTSTLQRHHDQARGMATSSTLLQPLFSTSCHTSTLSHPAHHDQVDRMVILVHLLKFEHAGMARQMKHDLNLRPMRQTLCAACVVEGHFRGAGQAPAGGRRSCVTPTCDQAVWRYERPPDPVPAGGCQGQALSALGATPKSAPNIAHSRLCGVHCPRGMCRWEIV
eukprot:354593-Chlamydomonas_euryale.AAC.3